MEYPSNGHGRTDTEATLSNNTAAQHSPIDGLPSTTLSGSTDSSRGALPDVVPPVNANRTLVLCFDGTGDQFDSDNSNIVAFFSMLKKDDRSKQMVYYQAGIGTYTAPQVATPFMSRISKTLDEMIAWNLHSHVMGGYEFLMQNYNAGDRICIFGFSRGAYTARSLAGMIHKVGVLPACNHQQVPFAYKMYTRTDDLGWKQSNAFKKAFSIDADIEFLGVWDTVNSVGIIPRRLPFSTSNTIVRTFRHAVALDERRAKFKANYWNRPNAQEMLLGSVLTEEPMAQSPTTENPTTGAPKKVTTPPASHSNGHKQDAHDHGRSKQREQERKFSKLNGRSQPTDVEEVWFAGCHCDIGGGSVDNDTDHNLARISLRWMIRECFKTKTGIMFHTNRLRDLGIDPACLYPEVLPRPPHLPVGEARIQNIPPAKVIKKKEVDQSAALASVIRGQTMQSEEEIELKDALCPIYDQLSLKWSWWILEMMPMHQRFQRGDDTWTTQMGMNMGGPRVIPKQKLRGVKIHRSVKMRMEAQHEDGSKYVPRPKIDMDCVTWVD